MKKYPTWADPLGWLFSVVTSAGLMFALHGPTEAIVIVPILATVIWFVATIDVRKQLREANKPILRSSRRRKMRYYSEKFAKGWKTFWVGLWSVAVFVILLPLTWCVAAAISMLLAGTWHTATGHAEAQLTAAIVALLAFVATIHLSDNIECRARLAEQKKTLDDQIAQATQRIGHLNDRETARTNEDALRATYAALGCAYAFGQIDLGKAMVHYLNLSGEVRQMNVRDYLQFRNITPAQDLPTVCLLAITERIEKEDTALKTYDIIDHWWIGWHNSDPLWKVTSVEGGDIRLTDTANKTVDLQPRCEVKEVIRKLLTFVSRYTSIASFALKGIAEYAVPIIARKEGDDDLGITRVALQLREAMLTLGCPLTNDLDTDALRIVMQFCKAERDPGRDTPVQ